MMSFVNTNCPIRLVNKLNPYLISIKFALFHLLRYAFFLIDKGKKMKRISFELDVPEFIDAEAAQEWLEFELGITSHLSDSNPLFGSTLHGKISKLFVSEKTT
jgi:hypothetical protein